MIMKKMFFVVGIVLAYTLVGCSANPTKEEFAQNIKYKILSDAVMNESITSVEFSDDFCKLNILETFVNPQNLSGTWTYSINIGESSFSKKTTSLYSQNDGLICKISSKNDIKSTVKFSSGEINYNNSKTNNRFSSTDKTMIKKLIKEFSELSHLCRSNN